MFHLFLHHSVLIGNKKQYRPTYVITIMLNTSKAPGFRCRSACQWWLQLFYT